MFVLSVLFIEKSWKKEDAILPHHKFIKWFDKLLVPEVNQSDCEKKRKNEMLYHDVTGGKISVQQVIVKNIRMYHICLKIRKGIGHIL